MLTLINSILTEKSFSAENCTKVSSLFTEKYSKYMVGNTDLSTAGFSLDFINRISYYTTMFQVLTMAYNEGMFMMVLGELKKDLETLVEKEQEFGKNLEKAQFMKENFFINGTELIVFVKSEFGYYFMLNNSELRVINLTNKPNGYHIFGDGRFCSGNTYQSLREVAKDGDVYSLVMFLINILANYDDKAHHLARPGDFNEWKKLDKASSWTRDELNNVIKIVETKYKQIDEICKALKVSSEWQKYIEEKITNLEDSFYAKVKE